MRSYQSEISTRSAIVLAFAIGLLLYVGWYLRHALLLIYFAAIVAVLLTPFVAWVSRWRIGKFQMSKGVGVLLLAIILAGLVALFALVALPPIVRDARQMSHDLPRLLSTLTSKLQGLPFAKNLNAETLMRWAERLVGGAFGLFKGVAVGVTAFITMIILAAYFIVDGDGAFRWGVSLFAGDQQPRLYATLMRGAYRMRRWLAGQFALMIIHGASATIAFGLLHLHYFYLLGVFAAVVNIIPVLGPVLTVIVAGLVAATQGTMKVLGAVIFFVVYHNLENVFLTPKIMSKETHLPAVSILAALLIGGELAGILGILAAVPTAALISVLIDEYLASDVQRV
jgi:predicted PurR-regulated permease PerM